MRRIIRLKFPQSAIISHFALCCVAALFLLPGFRLNAQCDQVGWVFSVTPGCGARIINLNTGEQLRAVYGADQLLAGETIRFSAAPVTLPAGCPSDGSPVALTCVSDTLPCVADFGFAVNQQNAYRLAFVADIYDPALQFCAWNFGDGSSAAGHTVQHTFPGEGYYTVCLTVTDALGCSTQKCRNIFVSDQNPNWCGYDVEITAVGTKLHGRLGPVVNNAGVLKSVQWFDNKTNAILAETAEFTATLPGQGTYYICAQYDILNPNDNSICTTTRCQVVTVSAPNCANPGLINTQAICPSFFAPVCACNGVTYANECEAIAAGITKWWAGECGAPAPGTCGSDLDAEIVSGSPTNGYTVRFHNRSSGGYTHMQLDFGDGSPVWQGGPGDTLIEHFYVAGGIYRANLSVWKANACVSSVTKVVMTEAPGSNTDHILAATDYVWPGDLNGDKKANVYDLLNLGLGFSASGIPRPFASTAWAPQFAPNWPASTLAGINFKHIDSDGNGVINDFDRNAIEQHYTPIDTTPSLAGTDAPKVWVKFAADTLDVDPNDPNPVQIAGDIMVGSAARPVFDLYGLAFALRYAEYINHSPDVYYSANSFFGFPTDILLLPKDVYDRRQIDMGFARKYGQPVSGFGSIAKINFTTDFIIIIDIIERSGSTMVPFTVPVVGLQAIDPEGKPLELEGVVRDTVWLNLLESTATGESFLQRQTLLYPNPASSEAWLAVGWLTLEHVDVFDTYGRLIEAHKPIGKHTTRLDTRNWKSGVYLLRIRTAQGIVTKRLIVQ